MEAVARMSSATSVREVALTERQAYLAEELERCERELAAERQQQQQQQQQQEQRPAPALEEDDPGFPGSDFFDGGDEESRALALYAAAAGRHDKPPFAASPRVGQAAPFSQHPQQQHPDYSQPRYASHRRPSSSSLHSASIADSWSLRSEQLDAEHGRRRPRRGPRQPPTAGDSAAAAQPSRTEDDLLPRGLEAGEPPLRAQRAWRPQHQQQQRQRPSPQEVADALHDYVTLEAGCSEAFVHEMLRAGVCGRADWAAALAVFRTRHRDCHAGDLRAACRAELSAAEEEALREVVRQAGARWGDDNDDGGGDDAPPPLQAAGSRRRRPATATATATSTRQPDTLPVKMPPSLRIPEHGTASSSSSSAAAAAAAAAPRPSAKAGGAAHRRQRQQLSSSSSSSAFSAQQPQPAHHHHHHHHHHRRKEQQQQPQAREEDEERDVDATAVGAVVRLVGLRSRPELNGVAGRVVDRRGQRVMVRVGPGGEEVWVRAANLGEVVEASPTRRCVAGGVVHPRVPEMTYERNKAALLREMIGSGRSGDQRLYDVFEEIRTQDAWDRIRRAFRQDYPECAGGVLVKALRHELTGRDFSRCKRILRRNGIVFDADEAPSDEAGAGVEAYAEEAMVAAAAAAAATAEPPALCPQCGRSTTMPFCGLTGEQHPPPFVPQLAPPSFLAGDPAVAAAMTTASAAAASPPRPQAGRGGGGTFKALLIACEYPGSGRELVGRTSSARAFRRLFAQNGLLGRVVLLSDGDGDGSGGGGAPSARNVRKGVEWLVEDAAAGDSLFVFYSGHWAAEGGGEGLLGRGFLPQLLSRLGAGVGLTCVFDCPCVDEIVGGCLPYRLHAGRGGAVRAEAAGGHADADMCDCTVVGYSSANEASMTGPVVAPVFAAAVARDFTPTYAGLLHALADGLRPLQVQPQVFLSWKAAPRDERLIIGEATLT